MGRAGGWSIKWYWDADKVSSSYPEIPNIVLCYYSLFYINGDKTLPMLYQGMLSKTSLAVQNDEMRLW